MKVGLAAAFSLLILFSPAVYADGKVDRISLLYSTQVPFKKGVPIMTVMLNEGRDEVSFVTSPGAVFKPGSDEDATPVEAGAGQWTARIKDGRPAVVVWRLTVIELPFQEKEKCAEVEALWKERGFEVKTFTVGSVFGMKGRVNDNRVYVVTIPAGAQVDRDGALNYASEIYEKYGVRVVPYPDISEHPSGVIEISDRSGKKFLSADGMISVERGGTTVVKKIEYGIGYSWHGYEDRKYTGEVIFTVDINGRLVVINSLRMTDLLKGLVPSEINPRAPAEALKAQAVAARSEILAKIGQRHPGNPYLLCAEQHCQVYSGLGREVSETSDAVDETEGEVVTGGNGRIVGTVYSSNCGGHTEDNDVVWNHPAEPALRGKPDMPEDSASAARWKGPLNGKRLEKWIAERPGAAWCSKGSFARQSSFRWRKVIRAEVLDAMVNSKFKIGKVQDIQVIGRGASGRVTGVRIMGDNGVANVGKELAVRRLFGNLKSGMFVLWIVRDSDDMPVKFIFSGGGWGHGVGMCQTGAMGMAENGYAYSEILKHYYTGTTVEKVY